MLSRARTWLISTTCKPSSHCLIRLLLNSNSTKSLTFNFKNKFTILMVLNVLSGQWLIIKFFCCEQQVQEVSGTPVMPVSPKNFLQEVQVVFRLIKSFFFAKKKFSAPRGKTPQGLCFLQLFSLSVFDAIPAFPIPFATPKYVNASFSHSFKNYSINNPLKNNKTKKSCDGLFVWHKKLFSLHIINIWINNIICVCLCK